MTAFQSAIDAAFDAIDAVAGVAVTYHRGANSVAVTAVLGSKRTDVLTEAEVFNPASRRDFLIDAAEIVILAAVIEPKTGDKIKQTDGGTTYVYQVQPTGDDPAWVWSDRHHRRRRIHTVFVGTE